MKTYGKKWTIKKLKKIIKDLPDETELEMILIDVWDGYAEYYYYYIEKIENNDNLTLIIDKDLQR